MRLSLFVSFFFLLCFFIHDNIYITRKDSCKTLQPTVEVRIEKLIRKADFFNQKRIGFFLLYVKNSAYENAQ
jgi:hypothetical protein